MNVFPNPAAEAFSIQVPLQKEMLSFTTIDITEKKVLSGKQSASKGIISVSSENQNSGLCHVHIHLGDESLTEKLLSGNKSTPTYIQIDRAFDPL
jgi:hypothetical protein